MGVGKAIGEVGADGAHVGEAQLQRARCIRRHLLFGLCQCSFCFGDSTEAGEQDGAILQ